MTNNKRHFDYIDSMRAIAALLVVWLHTSEEFVKMAQPSIQDGLYSVAHFFDFGRIGVVVFFAISGFVIPSSLSGNRLEGARSFLIKRFFRMYPLYWLSIPFGLITSWYLWGKEISVESILWNFTMLQEAAGHPSIQGLYWTLQTELVFYGLCLALFLAGGLRSVWVLSGLACVFTLAQFGPLILGAVGVRSPSITIPSLATMCINLGVMFWGALFRSWIERRSSPTITRFAVFSYIAVWIVFLAYAIKVYSINDAYFKLIAPYTIGVLLFTLLATARTVTSAWLVWLGTISYSIYLFHPVVMYSISRVVQVSNVEWMQGWTTGSYMLLTVVLTIAISAITHRYLELPAIRLGANLAARKTSKLRGPMESV